MCLYLCIGLRLYTRILIIIFGVILVPNYFVSVCIIENNTYCVISSSCRIRKSKHNKQEPQITHILFRILFLDVFVVFFLGRCVFVTFRIHSR
jgi:uncharacterized membrane protein